MTKEIEDILDQVQVDLGITTDVIDNILFIDESFFQRVDHLKLSGLRAAQKYDITQALIYNFEISDNLTEEAKLEVIKILHNLKPLPIVEAPSFEE